MARVLAPSVVARVVAAALLFWALDRHSYTYYQLLRIAVCAVAVWCAALAAQPPERSKWGWFFVACVLMFNPFVPLHLNRSAWAIVDTVTGLVFLVSIAFVRERTQLPAEPEPTQAKHRPTRRI